MESCFPTSLCVSGWVFLLRGGHIVTKGKGSECSETTRLWDLAWTWRKVSVLAFTCADSISEGPAHRHPNLERKISRCIPKAPAALKTIQQLKFTECLHCKPSFQERQDLLLQSKVSYFPTWAKEETRNPWTGQNYVRHVKMESDLSSQLPCSKEQKRNNEKAIINCTERCYL